MELPHLAYELIGRKTVIGRKIIAITRVSDGYTIHYDKGVASFVDNLKHWVSENIKKTGKESGIGA